MFQSTFFSSVGVDQKIRVNTVKLWKVTLGFIPAYANLYKRLFDQHGLDRLELKEARALLKVLVEREMIANGKTIKDAVDSSVSEHEIEEILASTASLPSVEWSDISESTGGWCDSETERAGNVRSESGSDRSYPSWTSSSQYTGSDSSMWSSDYLNWRKGSDAIDLSWIERFSRAVFGEI